MKNGFVIYRSITPTILPARQIQKLLKTCRSNNPRFGITGFLHYYNGVFLQYLEGPERPVFDRLAVISRDKRHQNVTVLANGEIEDRFFGDWDMGFLTAADILPEHIVCNEKWFEDITYDDAYALIEAFAEQADVSRQYRIETG